MASFAQPGVPPSHAWTAAARQQDEGPYGFNAIHRADFRDARPAGGSLRRYARPPARAQAHTIVHRHRRGHAMGRHRPRSGPQCGHPGAGRADTLRRIGRGMLGPQERQDYRGEGAVPHPRAHRQSRSPALPHRRQRGRGAGSGPSRPVGPGRYHGARHGDGSGCAPHAGPSAAGGAAGACHAAGRGPAVLLQRLPGHLHGSGNDLPPAAGDCDAAVGVAAAAVRPGR
jgi:hypothetical protein